MNGKELIRSGIIGFALVAGMGVGCGNGTGTGGTTSVGATTTGSTTKSATVGATSSTKATTASGATTNTTTGGGGNTLTVKNFLGWCNVTVGNMAASSAPSQTMTNASGTINLSATPNASFTLGSAPWHDTDKDPGTTAGMVVTSTVTVTGNKCVWVCCPTATAVTASAPNGDCPTMDQCP